MRIKTRPCAIVSHVAQSILCRCDMYLHSGLSSLDRDRVPLAFAWRRQGYKSTGQWDKHIDIAFPATMIFLSTALIATLSLLRFARSSVIDVSLARLFPRGTGCSTSGPASCHNTTVQPNLCCFEAPGVSPTGSANQSIVIIPFIIGPVATNPGAYSPLWMWYF